MVNEKRRDLIKCPSLGYILYSHVFLFFNLYLKRKHEIIDFEQRKKLHAPFSMITHVNDSNVLHILSIKAAHIERKYHNYNSGGNHNAKKT